MTDKATLREAMRRELRALSAAHRQSASAQLCQRLRAESLWTNAKSLLLFAPLSDEPDINPLLEDAWRSQRLVALPRYDAALGRYEAALVRHREDLHRGKFGAFEPGAGCPALPLNPLDLILVPGIAFDFGGRRLGRGKGFYDRLLAEVPGHKCGVAFDLQVVTGLPEESHDVRVDSILTPSRWQLCQGAA
jgi:5-formyltetrahydrofolate cyclo-ligase